MASYLAEVFDAQRSILDVEIWIEPFAGGLGAGLALLERDAVAEVWFSERNPALAAMWRSLLADPHRFADHVEQTAPSLSAYQAAAETIAATYRGEPVDDLTAGLAAFVINRCSRSGIVAPRSGPIGGKSQSGRWTIASRFDPQRLADRLRGLAPLTRQMRFHGTDAVDRIRSLDGSGIEDEVMVFVDPPYVREGNRLYASGMTREDHHELAAALNNSPARWALTYDDDPLVKDVLYPDRRVIEFDIAHTANQQRVAREYLLFSPNLNVPPDAPVMARGQMRWLRSVDRQWLDLSEDAPVGDPVYCQDELDGFATEGTLT